MKRLCAFVSSLLVIFAFISFCNGQNKDVKDTIESIFTTTESSFWNQFEIVTQPPLESLTALEKCGEGSQQGKFVCVPYYNCDGTTNMIIQEDTSPNNKYGAGLLDIRAGQNECEAYLDKCCQIPPGGLKPTTPKPVVSTPDPISSTTLEIPSDRNPTPVTQPPVDMSTNCGVRNSVGVDFQIRDNNGEAQYGEVPWMIAILLKGATTKALCGASLITPNVVLTGAHCVADYRPKQIKIRAGEWDSQTDKERIPHQERDVTQIIMHEGFTRNTLHNDVALLILDRPLSKVETIGTICLPNQGQRINSKDCFASGWGKDIFGKAGQYSVILKKVDLPIVEHSQCQTALRQTRLGKLFELHKSFICAGGVTGKDTCTGDGGSPLVCPDPNNPNRYVQVGIVAWGIGCGEGNIPGVYGDVTQFRSWIDEKLKQLSISNAPFLN